MREKLAATVWLCLLSATTWGAELGIRDRDVTLAEVLKDMGYATGQFGKNHLGDKDEHLPTNHGFDEFLGNLYHLDWMPTLVAAAGDAEHNSNFYWDWMIDKATQGYLGLATTAQFLQSFKAYPPSQRPDSWSIDRLSETLLKQQ